MKRLCHLGRVQAGITLVETMVAAGVVVASIMGLSASVQQASRMARSGKAMSSASEMMEERLETFRYAPLWIQVTTASGIAQIMTAPSAIASNFPGVTETFAVQPYPSGSTLVVTRSSNGTFSNNGVVLPPNRCVKVTVTATWRAVDAVQQTRQASTIIARGGL